MKSGCIGCLATILVRGKRTPDSSSQPLKTPENPISMTSRYIGCLATILVQGKRTPDSSSPHRITPETIETYHSYHPSRQCSFDPVTDRQTDKQTDKLLFRKTLLSVEGIKHASVMLSPNELQSGEDTR